MKERKEFEPTMECYKKAKAEGKGWEHLFVDEWVNVRAFLEGKFKK